MRQYGWVKKKGQASRLVLISVILTAALMRTSAVHGADPSKSTPVAQTAVSTTSSFSDIANHWAKQAIETAITKGYVKGYPDGTFKPNKEVTRAEFVKMVTDSMHLPVPATTKGEKWYLPYVSALKSAALLRESDLGTGWEGDMNRTEMSKLLVRGTDEGVRGKIVTDGEALFKSASAGLIGGIADGTLNEKGTTTRAEAVAVIERLSSVRAGGKLTVDKNAVQNAAIIYKGTNLEEAWGVKPITLPAKLDFGPQVNVTLDKMVVIDLDDPKSPLRKRAINLKSVFDGSFFKMDAYIVAMHFNLKTAKISSGMWSFNGNKITPMTDTTGYHWVYNDVNDVANDYFHPLTAMNLAKQQSKEGWYVMAILKNYLKQHPENKEVVIFNGFKQGYVFLSNEA
ncbi:S-layer homology domain-containing protein [Cohnella sp. JJ-181]|uniref:S-layer homology domain-containing protein n=1 Tax=Cohnella rhizoplanae TaxID=2974897 RepID=UPI0022FF65E2|nr:S-layer homology domain-containing protein [Cohnella sp. JJ-181]CAI6043111.1 hypothetical protein COHCIP112018_01166 [Cohnella sp. JJ-181]